MYAVKNLLKITLSPDVSNSSVELIAQNLIFVSVCVGGVATDATIYTLLSTDLIINN